MQKGEEATAARPDAGGKTRTTKQEKDGNNNAKTSGKEKPKNKPRLARPELSIEAPPENS